MTFWYTSLVHFDLEIFHLLVDFIWHYISGACIDDECDTVDFMIKICVFHYPRSIQCYRNHWIELQSKSETQHEKKHYQLNFYLFLLVQRSKGRYYMYLVTIRNISIQDKRNFLRIHWKFFLKSTGVTQPKVQIVSRRRFDFVFSKLKNKTRNINAESIILITFATENISQDINWDRRTPIELSSIQKPCWVDDPAAQSIFIKIFIAISGCKS